MSKRKTTSKTVSGKPPLHLVKNDQPMASTFATRNMLVDFTISAFHPRKLDKKVTAEVAKQHNVAESVGNYRKRLFPFPDVDVEALASKIGSLRQFHRTNTLPWGNGDTD